MKRNERRHILNIMSAGTLASLLADLLAKFEANDVPPATFDLDRDIMEEARLLLVTKVGESMADELVRKYHKCR